MKMILAVSMLIFSIPAWAQTVEQHQAWGICIQHQGLRGSYNTAWAQERCPVLQQAIAKAQIEEAHRLNGGSVPTETVQPIDQESVVRRATQ